MWTDLRYLAYLAIIMACGGAALAQTTKKKPERARLPTWEKFPSDIFFQDAFQEALVGSRPAMLGGQRSAESNPDIAEPANRNPASPSGWSRLVSAETLEDEVKSLQISIDRHVTTPSSFSGGGHQDVRREFSELAALFAVIAEFDRQVRWQQEAPTARDLFARAAANAKVTSLQAFREATQRKQDLQDLVRGGSIKVDPSASPGANWRSVCDRGPLMERFTRSYDEGIAIWTASGAEFKSRKMQLKREAELLKMFSVILAKDGMEDAGDADYATYCQQLTTAAEKLLRGIEDANPRAAREAASEIGKSCSQCHEVYRG